MASPFHLPQTADPAASEAATEAIPLDTSGLSRAERLDLLRKQCPELLPLIEEFRSRCSELTTVLEPVYALIQQGKVVPGPGVNYVTARRRLLLVYCLNISHYLTLRAERRPTDSHPVMRRIAQYGRLLQTLAPADQVMAPQLERLCQMLADGAQLDTVASGELSPGSAAAATAPGGTRRLKAAKRRPAAAAAGTAGSAVDRQLAALTMEIDALEREKRRIATEKVRARRKYQKFKLIHWRPASQLFSLVSGNWNPCRLASRYVRRMKPLETLSDSKYFIFLTVII